MHSIWPLQLIQTKKVITANILNFNGLNWTAQRQSRLSLGYIREEELIRKLIKFKTSFYKDMRISFFLREDAHLLFSLIKPTSPARVGFKHRGGTHVGLNIPGYKT